MKPRYTPVTAIVAACTSQPTAKNFQKSRPIESVPDQLAAEPVLGLDARTAVGQRAELAPDAAQVHVDAAVVRRQQPSERLLRQLPLADRPTRIAGQYFQQVEFGAGEL